MADLIQCDNCKKTKRTDSPSADIGPRWMKLGPGDSFDDRSSDFCSMTCVFEHTVKRLQSVANGEERLLARWNSSTAEERQHRFDGIQPGTPTLDYLNEHDLVHEFA